ncbi:hypothetical protein EJ08DRAFT_207504 [Tothia fuscella]|uniref:Monopolin complex subunit Csm1/Pcs1 C-terminal domain-containing protein n=1 Tax=Tothia fuscella TaxID=1048955 RepID=A0A9P4NRW7_9PEZI|nr:hypothetical protein EJ08DRAFT_207504 [Tothia fuscella]
MAPKSATLSAMVDPISDDEFARTDIDMMPTPDSQTENKPPTKRKAGRPKVTTAVVPAANKITKSKIAARRASGVTMPKKKATTAAATKQKGRKVLEERTNVPAAAAINDDGSETEEVDDFDDALAVGRVKKGGKASKMEVAPVKKSKAGKKAKVAELEFAAVVEKPVKVAKAATTAPQKKSAKTKRALSPEIPETQPDPMDMDVDIEPTELLEKEETVIPEQEPEPVRKTATRQPTNQIRASSRQPDVFTSHHRRAGSASDTERANDPALRRKLGDMTKKFENLDIKYRNLKEMGMNESSTNFEKLRKSSEKKAKDQDDIIASLKKELTSQCSLAAESKSLRTQITTLQSENQILTAESKTLSSSLQTAQNEIKTLSAKLQNARSSVQPESSTTNAKTIPGSAVKDRRPASAVATAAANAKHDEEKQIMKLKEDLYSDLSGLLIHNVKRLEDQDIYDCIQTGRNGSTYPPSISPLSSPLPLPILPQNPPNLNTNSPNHTALRFQLSISHFNPSTATPGPSFYDDAEFAYSPILDEKNDRPLLEILPDYLTEEIVFPRNSAAKFYGKVVECMSRRYED